mgnify:CR=1 FL=1
MEDSPKSDLLISTASNDKNNLGSTSDSNASFLTNPSVDLLLQQNADLEVECMRLR